MPHTRCGPPKSRSTTSKKGARHGLYEKDAPIHSATSVAREAWDYFVTGISLHTDVRGRQLYFMRFTKTHALTAVTMAFILLLGASRTRAKDMSASSGLDSAPKVSGQTFDAGGAQEVAGESLQELSERFPSHFAPFAATSISLRLHVGFTDAYESNGALFVITDFSPRMGYHDYHLARVTRTGVLTLPLSNKRLISLDASVKTSQAMILRGTSADGSSAQWTVRSGVVRAMDDDADVRVQRNDDIYNKASRCIGPASGKLTTVPLFIRGSAAPRPIPLHLLASATDGVSRRSSVKIFCRHYEAGSLVWLTNDDFGVTLVYVGSRLQPVYDQAPQFATAHYLIFLDQPDDAPEADGNAEMFRYRVIENDRGLRATGAGL